MKALVILANGFEEVEALAPIDILRRAKVDVTVAALENNPQRTATGSHGVEIGCDSFFSDSKNENFDAVILPGGLRGAENLASSAEVSAYLKKMNSEKKFICAICASPALVLHPLGILDGKKAVCYPGMEVEGSSTKFLEDRVLRDGNIITARGAGCAMEFGLEIVKALFSSDGEKIAKDLHKKLVC